MNFKVFDKYIEILRIGIKEMERGGDKNVYINDIVWFQIQGRNNKFYTFNIPLGKQIESYSDIEKNYVNYDL